MCSHGPGAKEQVVSQRGLFPKLTLPRSAWAENSLRDKLLEALLHLWARSALLFGLHVITRKALGFTFWKLEN